MGCRGPPGNTVRHGSPQAWGRQTAGL